MAHFVINISITILTKPAGSLAITTCILSYSLLNKLSDSNLAAYCCIQKTVGIISEMSGQAKTNDRAVSITIIDSRPTSTIFVSRKNARPTRFKSGAKYF